MGYRAIIREIRKKIFALLLKLRFHLIILTYLWD